jgi:hypothetical protein
VYQACCRYAGWAKLFTGRRCMLRLTAGEHEQASCLIFGIQQHLQLCHVLMLCARNSVRRWSFVFAFSSAPFISCQLPAPCSNSVANDLCSPRTLTLDLIS